ncbi:hypothetical protein [Stigmatella aurantiaca]|uniref:Uncharacterized protein n=1 Tax=Stigmatella aurantiaca (strain DW4/3-1) TaxID=378806 RepID=E3FEQ5_STIAD|nr:hypothetical protein [Stigmatella aurantiaca]ADO68886.1 uncharacterized protein STAUR_1082 [Stigmatella aurantiaca DW4/3-1]
MTLLTLRRALETARAKSPSYAGGPLLHGIDLTALPRWDAEDYADPREAPLKAQEFLRGVSWPEAPPSLSGLGEFKPGRLSKVLEWSRFAVELALGKVDSGPQFQLLASRFEGTQVFLKGPCTWGLKPILASHAPHRAAGILLHLIQDSFSHGPAEPTADVPLPGKTLRQRMENTQGALPAIETGARLIQMIEASSPIDAIMRFLDQNVFKLAGSLPLVSPSEGPRQAAQPLQ